MASSKRLTASLTCSFATGIFASRASISLIWSSMEEDWGFGCSSSGPEKVMVFLAWAASRLPRLKWESAWRLALGERSAREKASAASLALPSFRSSQPLANSSAWRVSSARSGAESIPSMALTASSVFPVRSRSVTLSRALVSARASVPNSPAESRSMAPRAAMPRRPERRKERQRVPARRVRIRQIRAGTAKMT